MPCFNAERYIRFAINSILNQTYKNFEFIIIDDGSHDSTVGIIESFEDDRILFLKREKNHGITSALNFGLRKAKGDFIARMDADDFSYPNRLEVQVNFLINHPEYILCGSQYKFMGTEITSDLIQSWCLLKFMLFRCNQILHPSVMFRRKIISDNNLFYNEGLIISQDYEFWIRMMKFGKLCNLPMVLLDYRVHNNQISNKKFKRQKSLDIKSRTIYLNQYGIKVDHQLDDFINRFFSVSKSIKIIDFPILSEILIHIERYVSDKCEQERYHFRYFKKIIIRDFIKNFFDSGNPMTIRNFFLIFFSQFQYGYFISGKILIKVFLNSCFKLKLSF